MNMPVSPLISGFDSLPDNRQKNLILIVVESFDSDLLYMRPNGKPALPNLWRIINEADSKIILDNIIPQIGQGRSSDGRFLYQTGIIPNPTSPVAMNHPVAHYPSLARAFSGNAKEFDMGAPLQWNKIPMSKSYGYRKIHTETDLCKNMKRLGGRDAALFTNSLPLLKEMKQPFLATLCTMDMHDPYDTFGWKPSDAWTDKTFSPQERVYIEKGRQFDKALANFIAGLKECGLYDNSVIAIVSDHTARENRLNGTHFIHPKIPAIILNSGVNLKSNEELYQCDIYPTLLDLTGRSDYSWRGFGNSVLREKRDLSPEYSCHLSTLMMDTGQWK